MTCGGGGRPSLLLNSIPFNRSNMDPNRNRIQEDLRGLLSGQVHCDDVTIQQYATDASIFEVRPMGVVRPVNHEDVVAVVNYARAHQIPLIPRGCGSGLAGEALGHGLVVDFSSVMHQVIAVGRETVTVQPGMVLASLNNELLKYGRAVGTDPSNRSFGTVGGAIARDACGSHWHDHGSAGDQVLGLRLVLADGETIHLGETATESSSESRSAKLLLQSQVLGCRQRIEPYLQANPFKVRPAGYRLHQIDPTGEIDLLPLLIGSEGTLAMMTEITLRTVPIPNHRGVVLLFFSRMTDAAKVAAELRHLPIRACDLVDRRLLTLAREADPTYDGLIPTGAEAMLLIEAKSDSESRLLDTLSDILVVADGCLKTGVPHYVTIDREKRDLCWHLVRRIIPTLYRLRGSTRAIPFLEDILVPSDELASFLIVAQELLNQQRLTASIFAHATQGRVQIRPLIDLASAADLARLEALANALYEEVWKLGGAMGTHGGLGLARTPFFRRQAGALYPSHAEVKRIFDPNFIFNPGKIVRSGFETYFHQIRSVIPRPSVLPPAVAQDPGPDSLPSTELPVAESHSPPPLPILEPDLNWDAETLAHATRNCNGCGQCRTHGSIERMCPVFRATRDEAASPRAKANLLRAVITGQLAAENLSTADMRAVTETCFNCHQCRIDCPAGVDVPKIVNEMRAQYVGNNGLSMTKRVILRLDWIFHLAHLSPTMTHFVLSRQWTRWILWRLFGIARQRKLPRFHGRTFLAWAKRRRANRLPAKERPDVVLFIDAFVNWNDPELGKALVAVLEHNGLEVAVPLNQKISGLSLISAGAIRSAKKLATANIALLADAVRLGAKVITVEPAATLALKHEYLHILSDSDARLVADNTLEATEFLWQRYQAGKLKTDFRETPVKLAHHLPCHQRATVEGNPGVALLNLIPKLEVIAIRKGCSGMAGMFGVFEPNFRLAQRIGGDLIREIRQETYAAGTTECSSCRIQMEQDSDKPTVHPIKILARAYGLMPALENVFERESHPNFLSW